jgi:RNA polymerase primary sigma factor
MNEYRIKVSIRNNLILKKIEEQGYKSVAEFERACEVKKGTFNALIGLRERPVGSEGEFLSAAKKLMEVLGAAPCELWTDEQLYLKLDKNSGEKEVSRDDIHFFLEQNINNLTLPSPEDSAVTNQTKMIIAEVVKTLTPKEEKIIKMRYENDLTYEQIGQAYGITSQRIRMIENNALRKMRKIGRIEKLQQI